VRGEDGEVAGRGILKIAVRDLMRQMRTMEVTGASTLRARLAGQARFGRYFAGAMFDVYGGVFARRAPLAPDAGPRKKRELRAEPPTVQQVKAGDGLGLQLIRYKGGDGEPVVLAHGLGTSSELFSLDTAETNLVEYLVSNGHDVWLLDWRGSGLLGGPQRDYTLDEVAAHDWPPAIAAILEATGAPAVHAVAEGVGSLALHAALLSGLDGVASLASIGVSPHVVVPNARRLGRGLRDVDGDLGREDLRGRLADRLLRLQPMQTEEHCDSDACRRATYVYGHLFEHDRLTDATHATIHELVALPSETAMGHLKTIARAGSLVDAAGRDVYLPEVDRLALPLTYLHGLESEVFRPEGTERTVRLLRERNGDELVRYVPLADRGHLDCLIGGDAVDDVYPSILEHIRRAATTGAVPSA
jgi:cholesterol oxidase